MSYMLLKSADMGNLNGGQVVNHSVSNVPMMSFMPGAPINAAVVFPVGGVVGRIKIVAGMGTVPHTLTAAVQVNPLFPTFLNRSISIPGPGTYYLPTTRDELIKGMKHISTNIDPGGSITISLDKWEVVLAADSSGPGTVAGVVHPSVVNQGPGTNILVIQSGAGNGIASGAIPKDSQLITATGGKVKAIGMATGVDIVGKASEDAVDGATFRMNVALSSV